MSETSEIAVSAGSDWLSGLVERRAGLFTRLGVLESRMMADTFAANPIDRPIYICGLARSGSTILLELLASHPHVATHRYRDFPLVFTPLWWNWFLDRASRESAAPRERAHKDRIQVTRDSPEAMEEPLWMAFFPKCHDSRVCNVLRADLDSPEFERFYRQHIQKILSLRNGTRYLAKGNYNLTRMGYLQCLFPDARFVVPVREPTGHIASLMKQHCLFNRLEEQDARVLNYMRRAGHFEFGMDRRPINVGDDTCTAEVERLWHGDEEVRGWARYWASLYRHVADLLARDTRLREATLVVDYSGLCEAPLQMLRSIYAHCALPFDDESLRSQATRLSQPEYYAAPFSGEELAVIEAETGQAYIEIRRFCVEATTQAEDRLGACRT